MEVEVRRFQEELGIPFVYVTHNQEEALTMSDRVAVMFQGQIEQVGQKLEVYNQPATRFVASFVGAPNKLTGRVTASANGLLSIDWDGLDLVTQVKEGLAIGDPVEIYIKSERIALSASSDGPHGEGDAANRLDGSVRDIIFKGQFSDYFVRLPNGSELVVSAPPTLPGIARGGNVQLSWSDQAADVFKALPEGES
jgi:ABC-type Fe3+/spermidine/putrescine transport system ATPase subunit